MDEELEQEIVAAEQAIAAEVRAVLDEVAADIVAELGDATEIVAARFSLARIGRMWTQRVPRLVRRLLGVAETAAQQAASDVDAELPAGWDDLPGRHDNGDDLPASLGSYVTDTEHLLRAVGDRLTEAAVTELAAGLNAGEDIAALRARLRGLFSRDGVELGETREERIARTESTRAWNAATLAAAEDLTGEGRPLVKQWQTRRDGRVRDAHDDADGQLRLLDEPFAVAGVAMAYPGDPAAPAALTVNCRCVLRLAPEQRAAAYELQESLRPDVFGSKVQRDARAVYGAYESVAQQGTPALRRELLRAGVKNAAQYRVAYDPEIPMTSRLPTAFHGTQGRPSYRKYHPANPGGGRTRHDRGGLLGSDRFSEEEHFKVAESYTLDGYTDMNKWLRFRTEPDLVDEDQVQREVSVLTDLINVQDPTTSETTMYRGMRGNFLDLREGDEFHDKGFVSTSKGEKAARKMLGVRGGYFFTIRVPAGAQVLDVASIGARSDEGEIILPPGTKFRVRRVEPLNDPDRPGVHYELEAINAVTAAASATVAQRHTELAKVAAAAGASNSFENRMVWSPSDVVVDKRAKASASEQVTAAATGDHLMGGMIALLPRDGDAQFLALPDGEDAGELHCTLWFLGDDAGQWTDDQRNELVAAVSARAADLPGPVVARAFGVNHWNPDSDNPAWVWAVGDDRDSDGPGLLDARGLASWALEDTHDRPDTPAQHTPWVAHVTGAYAADAWPFDQMCERLGAITFDRIRVAFAGDHYDIPLGPAEEEPPMATPVQAEPDTPPPPPVRSWSTPDGTALAFENEQTGDGRVLAPSAVYWDGSGPWPLQYAEAMGEGHQGAELAGAIHTVGRNAPRITGSGVLYLTQAAGFDAAMLLDQDAPLGVSVDLDDVDVQLVDTTTSPEGEEAGPAFLEASFASASVMRLADGAWMITGRSRAEWTASGAEMAHSTRSVMLFTSPGGTISGATARRVFGDDITAAAGDSDNPEGVVFHEEKSGDYLVRITRARLRGATLVSMPAYNKARIVLDPLPEEQTAAAPIVASSGSGHERLVTYVRSSPTPVGPRHLSSKLGMSLDTVHSHLTRALAAGTVVRIARGLYVGASTLPEGEITAAACGDLDLPVHDDREAPWDGGKAGTRVLAWATDDQGDVDPDKLAQAYLWRDPDKDPATAGAYKLPFADVFGDGEAQRLEIVADGVTSVAAVLEGSMGGVDLPDDDRKEIRAHVETLYGKLAKAFDDPTLTPPWSDEATAAAALDALYDERGAEIVASAWHAMQDEQPMPAAWFREPTAEELPPGSGGVHIVDGRAYGWVAQAGVPHAAHGRKVTIEKLAARGLDLSHFLRARFRLDDGTDVRAGAMTMNVGHHRDGYECESAVCQFDDSRTVAAVVTVGLNKGGLWFSGAAAPWLSPWDRTVFAACQPSYHMTQGTDGRWQLKAVLSVPVPGHSSPLTAAAVVDRSNLALTAAAVAADTSPAPVVEPEPEHTPAPDETPAANAAEVTAALLEPAFLDQFADALKAREEARAAAARAELAELTARLAPVRAELAASAAQQPEGN
ncbi:hypothetical protein QFZ66_005901 [Streptomyces sp. B4I13]|uniref:ADP-ribosyltransferase n=1 Tax=Streptomyces sp. B4I13 TaxID=3042271 RepID=UPI00278B36A5|nr:ADP-ribosyltransferase [Streptomyces sp. B4I13]MDQ0962023.1 hypothetical protein [Streptomyces sp. B4I13]